MLLNKETKPNVEEMENSWEFLQLGDGYKSWSRPQTRKRVASSQQIRRIPGPRIGVRIFSVGFEKRQSVARKNTKLISLAPLYFSSIRIDTSNVTNYRHFKSLISRVHFIRFKFCLLCSKPESNGCERRATPWRNSLCRKFGSGRSDSLSQNGNWR